ncbi:MAG TPA: TonB-dependent receptor, partial [Acidobacteriota bacterium]
FERLRVHGSLGTAFRAPRPFELSGPFGNAALIPEEVTGWDAGVDYDAIPSTLTLSAVVFQNQFSDLIGFNLDTFTFANFNEVETSGLELQVAAHPIARVRFGSSYTYLRTEDKTTGQELLRRPQNSGAIYVTYSQNRFVVHFNWSLIGERLDVNDITLATVNNPGYNRADLVLSYEVTDKLQPYLRVTNLFDQKYQEIFGFPSPDRGVFAGINFSL